MLGHTYSQVFESKYYGYFFACPVILVGILCGATLAFLVSRYIFKDFIKGQIRKSKWLSKNMRAINELMKTQGSIIVGLIRLTFSSFGITSHLFGVTSISLCQFVLGTSSYVFNILMQTFIGCSLYGIQESASDPNHKKTKTEYAIFIIELVITILSTIFMGYYAKKMIKKKLD